MDNICFFEMLNLDKKASYDDVKKAYNILVRKLHPDLHENNPKQRAICEEKLKKINLAYAEIKKNLSSQARGLNSKPKSEKSKARDVSKKVLWLFLVKAVLHLFSDVFNNICFIAEKNWKKNNLVKDKKCDMPDRDSRCNAFCFSQDFEKVLKTWSKKQDKHANFCSRNNYMSTNSNIYKKYAEINKKTIRNDTIDSISAIKPVSRIQRI